MKLNLGAGEQAQWLGGYTNIDRNSPHEFYREVYPLEMWGDESCEEVRASHVLEHFSHKETEIVLREWIRVLRPGGWLKIAVPDFRWIAEQYLKGETDAPLHGYVMGAQRDENDFHKAIFDAYSLIEIFQQLGLENIQKWESEIQDCAALPVSLNIMGQKPLASQKPVHRVNYGEASIPAGEVVAVLSMPRVGFTDMFHAGMVAFSECRLPVKKSSGVYWGQCMENLLEWAIAEGAKYALTTDYDSLFTGADIRELYRLATVHDVPCVSALQMQRDRESPLFAVGEVTGTQEIEMDRAVLAQELMPVTTAHFGLTLINLEALQRVPKPWFWDVPNEAGTWGEGKRDADIAFWYRWKEAGNQVCLAPHVVIGHLQLVASWPDKDLQVRHQYVGEYNTRGKPDWAWK